MGKARRKRRNNNKIQPTGIPSVKETEQDELAQSHDEFAIHNILDQILSQREVDRLLGLQSLLCLTETPRAIEFILKYKVLKTVGPFLVSKIPEVQNMTAGIIRNLSACGSPAICEQLVKDDIMTPLIALFSQYQDWIPDKDDNKEKRDTLKQIIHILWNLCESDETALKYFNSANLVNLLMRCLNCDDVDLAIAACQCLNSVSEDNTEVVNAVVDNQLDIIYCLLKKPETDNKKLLLQALATGFLMNCEVEVIPWAAVYVALVNSLKQDVKSIGCQLSSQLPLDKPDRFEDIPDEVKTLLEDFETLIDAQSRALEVLTNIITSADNEMDVDELFDVEDQSDDEDPDVEIEPFRTHYDVIRMPLPINYKSPEGIDCLMKQLVGFVDEKLKALPENVMDIFKTCYYSRSLYKKLLRLRCKAFLCFNNMMAILDDVFVVDSEYLNTIVGCISSQKFCSTDQLDELTIELIESATSAIRTILNRLANIKDDAETAAIRTIPNRLANVNYNFDHITMSDIEAIVKLGIIDHPEIRTNVVRIIGSLGIILKKHMDPNLSKNCANHLLTLAETQGKLGLIAEAIDALIDMFADDDTDQTAADINLVPRLKALLPQLKFMIKTDSKTLGKHYTVVVTVMDNLRQFIGYKAKRIQNL